MGRAPERWPAEEEKHRWPEERIVGGGDGFQGRGSSEEDRRGG
jgi:hypothetical protein